MTDRRGIAPPAPSVVVAQISETKSFFTSLSSPLGDVAFLLYFLVLALFYIPASAHDRTNIYVHNYLSPL